ncbi:MAG TPA: VOC family protein [Gemmatimonadales bacterium]|jgi:catechol 2,3-dioxygenase
MPDRAVAGSYGEPPDGFRLPEATHLGRVVLQVADLDRSLAYYQAILSMRLLDQDGDRALLGNQVDDQPLVELRERPGARPAPRRGRLGLYHFAILLPDRPSLGRFVQHLADQQVRAGSADHRVSEALYLQDPDNLGIEVYVDRPRAQWQRNGRQLVMAADPLDFAGLMQDAGTAAWEGMPAATSMGHLHLHVGDLDAATSFYSDGLGFDRMVWSYPGARFLGAGGYHHHLGTNTWAGDDAAPPSGDEAQLLEWNIVLPDPGSVEAVARSLSDGGHRTVPAGASHSDPAIVARDPWGTAVRVTV